MVALGHMRPPEVLVIEGIAHSSDFEPDRGTHRHKPHRRIVRSLGSSLVLVPGLVRVPGVDIVVDVDHTHIHARDPPDQQAFHQSFLLDNAVDVAVAVGVADVLAADHNSYRPSTIPHFP
jgi:hypothetical protein